MAKIRSSNGKKDRVSAEALIPVIAAGYEALDQRRLRDYFNGTKPALVERDESFIVTLYR